MTDLTKTITKGALGTVAAGAIALASATPAMAQERHRDRGVDAGDVIAGAVIIGGIAALAAYRGNYNNGYRGDRRGGRNAVERCVRAAERQARRFGGYRYADVTQVRDVDRTRYGFRVQGRLEVQGTNNYRGRNFDRGRFTCYIERGNRPQIDFRGIRGLR